MGSLTSAEVRWFFEGPVPDEMDRWFCRDGLFDKAAPREDHYLLFPAPLGLNIKLREGRLEIKSLVGTPGLRTFATDIAGHVELWEKRVSGDAAVVEFENLRSRAPHLWIAVGKKRTLRTFSLEGASMQEVAAGKVLLAHGCNVELTTVTVEGAACWSFGVEAFGEPSRVEAHMLQVARHIFTDTQRPPHPFPAANSRSYPEWLERFSRKT